MSLEIRVFSVCQVEGIHGNSHFCSWNLLDKCMHPMDQVYGVLAVLTFEKHSTVPRHHASKFDLAAARNVDGGFMTWRKITSSVLAFDIWTEINHVRNRYSFINTCKQ